VTLPAVAEVWSSETLVYVPSLPGYQVSGPALDSAFEAAYDRIDAFCQWLVEGELIPAPPESTELELVQTLPAEGTAGPIFGLDREPADDEHRELALSVGRAALSDLLFVLDDTTRQNRPEAERILRHVAELDRWYATRVAPASGSPFQALEDELVQSASLFEETIDGVPSHRLFDVWTIDGEEWSIRKVLRRRTGHLREHLPELLAMTQDG
jgi:hypothetical protein